MEKIAVITSGGDSQGMNTCLYNLVKCALINDVEIYGFMCGYQGIIDNDYIKLNNFNQYCGYHILCSE